MSHIIWVPYGAAVKNPELNVS